MPYALARGSRYSCYPCPLCTILCLLSSKASRGALCGNVSPQLSWNGAPAGTTSFALTMYDPDAPTGSGFWHWLIMNIPPAAKELPKGSGKPGASGLPAGSLQTRTDFGTPGYGGPCPPKGDKPHHYQFTLFAVGMDKLPVDENTSGAVAGFNLHFHTLAKATFTATYGR
ncbi:MAG TPA: YbhB/YbcL family Raf kinase inhibitor-like protein [Reyranella sp.]